jgi:hypothetical protein
VVGSFTDNVLWSLVAGIADAREIMQRNNIKNSQQNQIFSLIEAAVDCNQELNFQCPSSVQVKRALLIQNHMRLTAHKTIL